MPARRLKTRRINNYVIAWQAAQDGQGVALGWLSLVAPLLEARKLVTVTKAQFEQALRETRPSVTPEMERDYEEMLRTLKQEGPQRQPIGFVPVRQAAE